MTVEMNDRSLLLVHNSTNALSVNLWLAYIMCSISHEYFCLTDSKFELTNTQLPVTSNRIDVWWHFIHHSRHVKMKQKYRGKNVGRTKQNRLETTWWVFQVNGVQRRKGTDNGRKKRVGESFRVTHIVANRPARVFWWNEIEITLLSVSIQDV